MVAVRCLTKAYGYPILFHVLVCLAGHTIVYLVLEQLKFVL